MNGQVEAVDELAVLQPVVLEAQQRGVAVLDELPLVDLRRAQQRLRVDRSGQLERTVAQHRAAGVASPPMVATKSADDTRPRSTGDRLEP